MRPAASLPTDCDVLTISLAPKGTGVGSHRHTSEVTGGLVGDSFSGEDRNDFSVLVCNADHRPDTSLIGSSFDAYLAQSAKFRDARGVELRMLLSLQSKSSFRDECVTFRSTNEGQAFGCSFSPPHRLGVTLVFWVRRRSSEGVPINERRPDAQFPRDHPGDSACETRGRSFSCVVEEPQQVVTPRFFEACESKLRPNATLPRA